MTGWLGWLFGWHVLVEVEVYKESVVVWKRRKASSIDEVGVY